jgi:phage terminase large subunit
MPVILSSDIGFRDAAAFWFWQCVPDGFNLIDYREESGLDADDWLALLKEEYDYDYAQVWLPHDAKAKTFATKRSALERFRLAGLAIRLTPTTTVTHRINAARLIMPRCRFNSLKCARGIEVLRSWAFRWDDERRVFSNDPLHDEFSHGGDAFSYGALVMNTPEIQPKPKQLPKVAIEQFSLNQLHGDREEAL